MPGAAMAGAVFVIARRYDDRFILRSADGHALSHMCYAIQHKNGIFEYGETDSIGHTHFLLSLASAENINIYLAG